MKKVLNIIMSVVALAVIVSTWVSPIVNAYDICQGITTGPICGSAGSKDLMNIVGIVTDTLMFILGTVSVIVLIIGGIRYTISGGDSTAVGNAKNSILYGVIGIVVALSAYAIVHFVIVRLTT